MKLFEVWQTLLIKILNGDIAVLTARRIIQVLVKGFVLVFCDDTDAGKGIRHDFNQVQQCAGLTCARCPDNEHTKGHFDVVDFKIGIVIVLHILLDPLVLVEIG